MIDVLIIGTGAAGMTAALYCLRNGKSVTILEQNTIGGQIAESPRVENFPTIMQISGSELADKMFDQIIEHGAEFKFGKVVKLEKSGDYFTAQTEFDSFEAKTVIIATGVEHRKLNIPREEELSGHGVSYCALCDGAFYAGEDVAIVGGGNTALQYALLLSSQCKTVHVVTLLDKFSGDEVLIKALEKKQNIKVTHNAKLVSLEGEKELSQIVFEKPDKTLFKLSVRALFVAIGQVPNNGIFEGIVDLDKDGYILCDDNMKTKAQGLFVAGDCRQKTVRQLTTACSDGAIAATSACQYLETK